MQCPRCQHQNEAGAKFREECAAPLARACPKCSRPLSPTAKSCPECAHPTGLPAAPPPARRFGSPEAYTPKHLAEKILSSKRALEGERKQVTVLFAALKGSMELLAVRDPEGWRCPNRSTERLTGVRRDTSMRLTIQTGEHCDAMLADTMRNLRCRSLQVDELWTFVQKKQARLSFEDRLRAYVGDQYCFLAIDAETKLLPHFDVGERNIITAYRFMEALMGTLGAHGLKGGLRCLGKEQRGTTIPGPPSASTPRSALESTPSIARGVGSTSVNPATSGQGFSSI
jgi:hypothetical protein